METQKRFAESLKLPFPLLADPGGEVAKKYGVLKHAVPGPGGGGLMAYAQRVTFVIDKDGVVQKVVEGKEAIDPAPALNACPMRQPEKKAGPPAEKKG